jgi:methylmalonyl-CoA/ethylmalonyl-CoA epimerase
MSEGRVLRIAHVGVATPDLDGAGTFWDLLGLPETHREEVTSQQVATSFRPVGESFVELLEPLSDESPIHKFLIKNRPGIHHLCLEVDDVVAVLSRLKAKGVRLVNETPFEGAHGCLVAFVHPASTGGILLELSQRKADASGG